MNETKRKWSIAIHGGAGGGPATWSEAKRAARSDGLERALQKGADLLKQGAAAIDVVEAVIVVFEDDANFNAGRGAVLTEDGVAELDASIMDGRTAACGAVASVTKVKNPISLARLVMTQTPHVLLVGKGADEFAEDQSSALVTPDYFMSRQPEVTDDNTPPHFGTVGCVAYDSLGNVAAGTSTGGTTKKLPGRVGDSPIIGAGTYATNDACAVSCTGLGEEFIRACVAYDLVAQMRYAGRSLEQAVDEVMVTRLAKDVGGLIAVSNHGRIVMQHNTPGMNCGMAHGDGQWMTSLALSGGRFAP
ncbi:isoaspartyl peptidase/L-asparaginase family protein [Rubripirellula tenax]|nr:isoaspartyl peptidase/L-asparaginase [Rubripirellula tenax]